jgi:hypothetical protein
LALVSRHRQTEISIPPDASISGIVLRNEITQFKHGWSEDVYIFRCI